MGDRGYNAGGWAYMLRVWCPKCGWSYLTGNRNRDRCSGGDTERPKLPCLNSKKCRERQSKKKKASTK